MIALLATLGLALGQACDPAVLTTPPERFSVAWVSPLGQRVSGRKSLVVSPTRELAAFLQTQHEPSVGRLLQFIGARKSNKPPKRAYKVTVFDVSAPLLCRPVDGHDEGDVVAGLRACAGSLPAKQTDGCGVATDHGSKRSGPTLLRIRWRDAARNGFCVLPAERFIQPEG